MAGAVAATMTTTGMSPKGQDTCCYKKDADFHDPPRSVAVIAAGLVVVVAATAIVPVFCRDSHRR